MLRNTGNTSVTIFAVTNREDFVLLDLETPCTLDPDRSVNGVAIGAFGAPVPGEIVLETSSTETPIIVPIPPRPI
ncbi:hypothetical protein [Schaalia sp. lx-260]|uniref:hypothetical protein n=1 Tax=Schaalia sp. lx-260 TaxID=2899082 RepID=UPI001E34D75D|nr:hypothetical protein [Schaalia sp. lx-260]MCD4549695.1 hypothetical protein [Schaalia sp. lx-260]